MIRKSFIAALCILLCAGGLRADDTIIGGGVSGMAKVASAGYTGPGDIFAFSNWWGLRAYSAAKRGSAAIRLCDNAGANCADISTNATTGVLNNPGTLGANNCNTSGTCLITTFYDQAGVGNCTQATTANMPALNMTGGPGGNTPAAIFTRANSDSMTCGSPATTTQPFSFSAVAERTGTTGSFNSVIGSGGPDVLFNNAANGCGIYAGSVFVDTTHCADSAWHAINGMYNNTTSKLDIDANNSTGTAGTSVSTSNYTLGTGIGGLLDGRLTEVGAVSGDQSSNFATLNTNQHNFWGF